MVTNNIERFDKLGVPIQAESLVVLDKVPSWRTQTTPIGQVTTSYYWTNREVGVHLLPSGAWLSPADNELIVLSSAGRVIPNNATHLDGSTNSVAEELDYSFDPPVAGYDYYLVKKDFVSIEHLDEVNENEDNVTEYTFSDYVSGAQTIYTRNIPHLVTIEAPEFDEVPSSWCKGLTTFADGSYQVSRSAR